MDAKVMTMSWRGCARNSTSNANAESGKAIQLLKTSGVKDLVTINVLEDPEVRQGIKEYSNWPTVPQLYVKGEFVGGSDIMNEMFESGELQTLLKA